MPRSTFLRCLEVTASVTTIAKGLLYLKRQFPIFYISLQNLIKGIDKNLLKFMQNPIFVDDKKILLVTHHDEDHDDNHDDYNTQITKRVDETTFTMPDTTETLQLWVKRNNLAVFNEHLEITGNILPINLYWFRFTENSKKDATILGFYHGDEWVPLTKKTKKNRQVCCTKNITDRGYE